MTDQAMQIHQDLIDFQRISPILLMRRTKQTFDHCVELYKAIQQYRIEIGYTKVKKKKKIVPGNLVMFEVNRMRREARNEL